MTIITRNRNELRISLHNTALFNKSTEYQAIKAFKDLPSEIKQIQGIKQFRSSVICFLKEKL